MDKINTILDILVTEIEKYEYKETIGEHNPIILRFLERIKRIEIKKWKHSFYVFFGIKGSNKYFPKIDDQINDNENPIGFALILKEFKKEFKKKKIIIKQENINIYEDGRPGVIKTKRRLELYETNKPNEFLIY